ncbi:hypothetical protein DH2020_040315 [Rehmannia glutinosa]|uniref:Uncharacterized protein n=1 Tax=Rehmannia glutinosa TaxID=99300 RepID=A0ABR0UUF9_REHGL
MIGSISITTISPAIGHYLPPTPSTGAIPYYAPPSPHPLILNAVDTLSSTQAANTISFLAPDCPCQPNPRAWNIQTSTELSLDGPVGQVYSLVVGNDLLLAGTQEGTILAWKFNVAANCFEPAASLKGHTLAVVTLVVGGNRMYSGSMDQSIRVWSLETLQCVQTLPGHTDVVMSVLCWDHFLLSASLDKTVKVWAATETGKLEVTYTHTEEHGILTLCGMHDSEAKPVLLCSCNDNAIRVYDLPS